MPTMNQTMLVILSAGVLTLSTTGCATKKHVMAKIAPIEGRLGENEKKTKENSADIDQLHAQTSKIDERVSDVDRQAKAANQLAGEAKNAAGEARNAAGSAQNKADAAHGLATDGIAKTDRLSASVNDTLDKLYANLDNFQKMNEAAILFPSNVFELSKDAKAQLDALIAPLTAKSKFILEVRGFADTTGPTDFNLALSRQRAEAVVRYLNITHNIPLRRIQVLGAGTEAPAADNKTRTGRQQNRRVEVKVFGLPEGRSEKPVSASL